jgi:riboflavin synthase
MFAGIVETLATVHRVADDGAGRLLEILVPFATEVQLGDSVALNGVCLTAIKADPHTLSFQAGPETLSRTNLGELSAGTRVNVERALRLSDRLGGHFVQGHVDGVGQIEARMQQGEWQTVWFRYPPALAPQMVSKGSIAVDGVSLTLVDVEPSRFSVALIPHTLGSTTLGVKEMGANVNLETDIIAKLVCKCVQSYDNGRRS